MKTLSQNTPVYVLDTFSAKAERVSFYMESLEVHLREHAFVNKPHKHDFYLLLFFARGSGTHTIDFQSYEVGPGSVFAMTPGQVHSWTLSDDVAGFVLFFKPEFYQMQLRDDALLEFPFFHSLSATPLIRLGNDTTIDLILNETYAEFKKNDLPDLRMIRGYLEILLLKLSRCYQPERGETLDKKVHKLRTLEQLIEANFKRLKHPSDYADLMNLTPSYLNNICKSSLGKTLGDLIHERVMLEAKRLFAYTDLSVKEVAHMLGFSDSSYFVRWFKKEASMTPDMWKSSTRVA